MVKKSKLPPPAGQIRKTDVRSERLTYSFLFFSHDDDLCPMAGHPEGYWLKLLERLRDLSTWTVAEFVEKKPRGGVRNHSIDWSETSRPSGFSHVPPQAQEGQQAWQFALSKEQHGRVHGLLIGNIFHVVWLDINHKLYSGK